MNIRGSSNKSTAALISLSVLNSLEYFQAKPQGEQN